MAKKVVKSQWDEKYLRESPWMPFGSMCNLIGQALRGTGMSKEQLESLAKKAFELSMNFTEKAFDRVTQDKEEKDLPIK